MWLGRLYAASALVVLLSIPGCSTPVEKAATENKTEAKRRKAQKSLKETARKIAATFDPTRGHIGKLRGNMEMEFEAIKGEDFRYRGVVALDVSYPVLENEHFFERWSFECIYLDGEWLLRTITAVPSATADADDATKQTVEQLDIRVREIGDVPVEEYNW
jgi:hypothetical protein